MNNLIQQYNSMSNKVNSIYEQIESEKDALAILIQNGSGDMALRIQELEAQIEKIDKFVPEITKLNEIAQEHITSLNYASLEAPDNYRVNVKRLYDWAAMINPYHKLDAASDSEEDDPYARRLYVASCNDLFFLNKKRTEYEQKIEQLKDEAKKRDNEEAKQRRQKIEQLKTELHALASGKDMTDFATAVLEANTEYSYKSCPEKYVVHHTASTIALGAYDLEFKVHEGTETRSLVKKLFGDCYDERSSRILLPFELQPDKEFAVKVTCTTAKTQKMDRGIQNLIMSIIDKTPPGENKVYFLDATRYNTAGLGPIRALENTFALAKVPRNSEQMTSTLEEIVSSFDDMDDALGFADSVIEYNATAEDSKKLSRTTVILIGWPKAFTSRDNELIHRIMVNYERYGVSFVSVEFNRKEDKSNAQLPEYADQNAIHVYVGPNGSDIAVGDNKKRHFQWYELKCELTEEYCATLAAQKVAKEKLGNDYTKRNNIYELPDYTRTYKKMVLPFGIDGKDEEKTISFEDENFAAFLMGASRSGKSTLLHTLITGIIKNYHPDNVELWLADFKQLEFKPYTVHCPPHVKYVLLDESQELVFDLIDKLTEKMLERQRLFAQEGVEKLSEIEDPSKLSDPLPIIFVILDEFSIMSQAVKESSTYQLKLQNILAKGAALGFRFIFASQTFTTGVSGLTSTARAQIQQRIAMKGRPDEIVETLELTSDLKTDRNKNWMNSIAPHYALVKYRTTEKEKDMEKLDVMRVLVEWIPKYDDRDSFIDMVSKKMSKSEEYRPEDIMSYVDKHPVLVDGNAYAAFSREHFETVAREMKKDENLCGDESFAVVGTPRLMEADKPIILPPESRENILLVSSMGEKSCAASVISSVMKSFLAQGKSVHIWAYSRDRIYRSFIKTAWSGDEYESVEVVEDFDNISLAIKELAEKIKARKQGNDIYILLGMDRICGDFELGTMSSEATGEDVMDNINEAIKIHEAEVAASGAGIQNFEEDILQKAVAKFSAMRDRITEEGLKCGKTQAEIDDEINAAKAEIYDEADELIERVKNGEVAYDGELPEKVAAEIKAEPAKTPQSEKPYNAANDFKFSVTNGSRFGYHFMLNINYYSDIKTMQLKIDYFRHRMAFQISREDSDAIFGNKIASLLPEHVFEYSDTISKCSFRPYLHKDIVWEGWTVDAEGKAINPLEKSKKST